MYFDIHPPSPSLPVYTTFAWEFKGVYYAYFPGQYLAMFGQGNTRNAGNKLPVATIRSFS